MQESFREVELNTKCTPLFPGYASKPSGRFWYAISCSVIIIGLSTIPGNVISNLGIVGALKNLDQFKNLSPLDQRFILEQAGGNRPAKDRFGYNIRSARGNYAQLVGNRADIARDRRARGLTLRAIDQYYLNKEKEKRALEAKAQRDFLASENRGGDGPQNNPQGGLGRQDYSRAPSADFAALADELGIEY